MPGHAAPDDARLVWLAERQHGLVSWTQLVALGYSRHMVLTLVRRQRLHRLYPGVYAVGHTRLSVKGQWMAAVLACGKGAVLSHRAAAALHDLRQVPTGAIDVTAPTRHQLPGIRCHGTRVPLDLVDVEIVGGIPVTSIPRLLLDLAETFTEQQLLSTMEAAERQDKLDLLACESLLARSPGRHGAKALQRVLAQLREQPWTQSELERAFLALTREAGLPVPSLNVVVEGVLVDAVFPEQRLVVEIDGWRWHRTRRRFEDDRRRDIKLQIAGYRVVRFTYQRIMHEAQAVGRELELLLGRPGTWGRWASARGADTGDLSE